MPHFCDVIGCKNERRRHQRLCARCYAALPDWLRLGIIEAKRLRRGREWRHLRHEAADYLGTARATGGTVSIVTMPPCPRNPITPERAYALTERMLGENL